MMTGARFDVTALEALCVDNKAPTGLEIGKAKAEAAAIAPTISEILTEMPPIRGYARKQEAFTPIMHTLEQYGWTLCGSGYFSAAFFKGGLVIKVGLKSQDSGLMYAAWCRANQGRAGVPVLHHVVALHNCYVVVLDRLEAITDELTEGGFLFDARIAAEVSSVKETINQGVDGWGKHMELCRTAMDIREFFIGIARFDIHNGNMMLDRDGNVVITDPVSFMGTDGSSDAEDTGYTYTYSEGYHDGRN